MLRIRYNCRIRKLAFDMSERKSRKALNACWKYKPEFAGESVILKKLKSCGWNTGRIRKEGKLGEATVQKLRRGEIVSLEAYDFVCNVLNCDIGDIIEHIKESD